MSQIKLGLKENLNQFILLVIVNAFVGAMIGMERTIIPQIAELEFNFTSASYILSFITVFGIAKAVSNYLTGNLSVRYGKKKLLVAGWLIALPVPLLLMYAQSWSLVIVANILLGIHQGLTWSTTVMMKIDLVGEKNRGLAMGLNESSGYVSVALVAYFTGWIAANYGLRPYPFIIGIVIVVVAIFLSIFFVRDTQHHVEVENFKSHVPLLKNIFWSTTVADKNLSSITQAGLVNNLNDAMVWGLLPLLLASKGFSLKEIGLVAAVYPFIWGIGQLATGRIADFADKKKMLASGMLLQGIVILFFAYADSLLHYIILSVLLGAGTAMVYPVFLAAVADNVHPSQRAQSLSTFRFWRDSGYAIGAILTGIAVDLFSMNSSIQLIGLITIISGIIIKWRMVI